jgi:hypothetical protein
MLVSHNNISKKPSFSNISKESFLLNNALLNHRVYFDFKTDTVDYRLRMLPKPRTDLDKDSSYLQINFKFQGQSGIVFCEASIISAILDLEATDFDVNKLSRTELNAIFSVLQCMIEENYSELSGLMIQQLQLTSLKALKAIPAHVMPVQTIIKVTSIEHFSYMHVFLSSHYSDLLQSLIDAAPVITGNLNPPQFFFKQDLELHGCTLNKKELQELEIGDVLLFNQGETDYRICLDDQYHFSLSANKKALSLLSQVEENYPIKDISFNISIKLHQALVKKVEDTDILHTAQQQIEHAKQKPLKILYCNDKPFAVAERISICDRLGMRIQSFL